MFHDQFVHVYRLVPDLDSDDSCVSTLGLRSTVLGYGASCSYHVEYDAASQ